MRIEPYKLASKRERLLDEATERGESVIHEDFGTGVNGANVIEFDVIPKDMAGERQSDALKRLKSRPTNTPFEADMLTAFGLE